MPEVVYVFEPSQGLSAGLNVVSDDEAAEELERCGLAERISGHQLDSGRYVPGSVSYAAAVRELAQRRLRIDSEPVTMDMPRRRGRPPKVIV